MEDIVISTQDKIIKCSTCHKDIKESDGVKKLRGALVVCKECDEKDKSQKKEGEVCEFC